ncbi:MAG: hypothetical protein ACKO7M_03685, partial [Acinetobacter junii]
TEQDRIEYFKNEISRLSSQVVDLLYERDQLQAQIEVLRSAALNAISVMPGGQAKADLRDAYDATPDQCLAFHDAEIKAQAVIDAIDAHKNRVMTFGFDTAIRVNDLIKYANQLRQRVKAGEK